MGPFRTISYTAFGSPMPTRVWSDPGSTYKFGFNTQEKDDEIAGNGNINSAEHWEYDTRLGRRWNIDFISKPSLSSFSTFHNNPMIHIDPTGNDDYYNQYGMFLYSDTKLSNDIRILNQDDFDRINLKYFVKLNDKSNTYGEVILALEESSKVATVAIEGKQLDDLWFESFPKGEPRKEQNAMLLLDLTDTEKPKIVAVQTPDAENSRAQSVIPETQKVTGDDNKYYQGKVVLGAIHTHPMNSGEGNQTNLSGNQIGAESDGATALKIKIPIFNLYGPMDIEKNSKFFSVRNPGIDAHAPYNMINSVENVCNYNDGQKLGKTALDMHGKAPLSKDAKSIKKTPVPF